jgi:hypothetical protein
MHHIPAGTSHVTTTTPWRVVAKAIDHGIPHGLQMIKQKSFCQGDSHRHNNQIAALKLV